MSVHSVAAINAAAVSAAVSYSPFAYPSPGRLMVSDIGHFYADCLVSY
jgi:hypothetical protein